MYGMPELPLDLDLPQAKRTIIKPKETLAVRDLSPENFGTDSLAVANNIDFMRSLTTGSIQLIVTSPPYNIGKPYEPRRRVSINDYIEHQRSVIAESVRLVDERGSICWQVGNHLTSSGEVIPLDIVLYPTFKHFGLHLRNRIVWHFGHGLHSKKRLSGRYETIMWFTKGNDYRFNLDDIRVPSKYPHKKHYKGPRKGQISSNPLGKNPGDVWLIPNVKANHVEKTDHPCQFPVELVERLVLSLTNEGDTLLDPYVGVGSSVIAAVKHGRNGYGVDTDQNYIEIARDRLKKLRAGTLGLRPLGKKIYEPDRKER